MPPPLCIHCLAAAAQEGDHVLPRSWYPDGTDPNLRRLTVPSCKPCGEKLKRAEEQMALAIVSAKGFDRNHPAAAGIFDRVRKTWNAVAADSPREFEHRRDRLYSLMTRMQPIIPSSFDAIGAARVDTRTPAGVWIKAAVAMRFRWEDFEAVVSKFVRGLHYHRTGTPLPREAKIIAFDPPLDLMREDVARLPDRGSLSEGLLYRFCQDEHLGRSFWFFLLWGQANLAAVVDLPGCEPLPSNS